MIIVKKKEKNLISYFVIVESLLVLKFENVILQ
jgi:hypothetical protein